jgi:hypothetical protein
MNSNTLAIILDIYLHTYAICRTSGRIVLEGKSLFISVFQAVLREVVLRAFPVLSHFIPEVWGRSSSKTLSQAVVASLWPQKTGFDPRLTPCGVCVGQSGTGIDFLSECVCFPLSASFHLTKYIFIYYWRDTYLAVNSVVEQLTGNEETEWCFQPQILVRWICQKTYNALILVANIQRERYVSTRF